MRARSVPAIATSDTIPAEVKKAIIVASYIPIPPGVKKNTLSVVAKPKAINKSAGLIKWPKAKKVINIKPISQMLARIAHKKGFLRIFLSRRIIS